MRTSLVSLEPRLNIDLALVLTHDLLFARRGIMCGDWVKSCMMRHRADLRLSLSKIAIERGISIEGMGHAKIALAVSNSILGDQALDIPRFVRVNTIKTSVDSVIAHFNNRVLANGSGTWVFGGTLHDWKELKKGHFYQDLHLTELLVFPHGTDFHLDSLYVGGEIILQDKASAFPAHILSPPVGSQCIDACAAPGNKTTHLGAILRNQGSIVAYDLDDRRLHLLRDMTLRAGCTVVTPVHANFLEIDPDSLPEVTHILVDPSCSGSGIVSRLDHLVDTQLGSYPPDDGIDRLAGLAEFQANCVLHAMNFPSAQYICYSTCSIHVEENENVVARVLQARPDFVLSPRTRVLPSWSIRGQLDSDLGKDNAQCVIRSGPELGTNGFFVALFERQRVEMPNTEALSVGCLSS